MEKYYLWLVLALGEGEPEITRLLNQYGDPESVYEAFRSNVSLVGPELLARAESATLEKAEKLRAEIAGMGYDIITRDSPDYPEKLKKVENPPCVLFAHGDTTLLRKKLITMVGSRNMTDYTERIIPRIIEMIAREYAIVGTLSEGCDQTVCLNALRYGLPFIEVMPCGLSQTYPGGSKTLRKYLTANGGLRITEYLPKEKAGQGNFLRRSRILGGISYVTLVLQARTGSGALATAEYSPAPLFMPPNNVFAPEYAGTVNAVRNGAKLYMGAKDIYLAFGRAEKTEDTAAALKPNFRNVKKAQKPADDEVKSMPDRSAVPPASVPEEDFDSKEQYELYEIIRGAGTQISLEELIAVTGQSAAHLSETLLDLEIAGKISSAGSRYSVSR